ncbi:MAG: hypothetical protein ACRYFB_05270 [Janthinobacterium lividum]
MKKIYYLLILFLCLNALQSSAQTISLDDDKSAGLKGGISYLSNNVFMGRTDTVTSKIIAPQLLYTFKSGFYVSGTLSFILNQKQHTLDGSSLEAGYNYAVNDNLYGGVSFSKYFYGSNSTRITSAISSIFNAYLNYDLGDIITPELSVSYSISDRNVHNDIFVNPGITHQFIIDQFLHSNNALEISPEFSLNSGTQNFYNGYFSRRRKNLNTANQLSTADQLKLTNYTLLDYEAQLPIKFKAENYLISLTPSFAFPQNKLPDNISSKLANKRSLFYFEASVLYKF